MVTHPGNATDGDTERGIRANGEGLTRALEAVPGVRLLCERAWDGALLAFRLEGRSAQALAQQLQARGVHCRTVSLDGQQAVRLSVGFWNRPPDLAFIAHTLRTLPVEGDTP